MSLVDKLSRNTPIHFHLTIPKKQPRLDRQTEFELYSICLELLNNTLKHANATRANLTFTQANGTMQLTIDDNGTGLASDHKGGKGLQSVAARVDVLGGTWAVDSNPERGVVHRISIPISAPGRSSSQT